MTDVYLAGTGKFAAQVARYVLDASSVRAADWSLAGYIAVDDSAVCVPPDLVLDVDTFRDAGGGRVVLAVSDVGQRIAAVQLLGDAEFLNLVHPTSLVDEKQLTGAGNVIGPFRTLGACTTLDSFNVVTNHSSFGNHARVASNNFFSPGFHCGNSVEVGSGNFFGMACAIAPEVCVGDRNVFGAGTTLSDNAANGRTYISTARVKAVPQPLFAE